MADKIAYTLSVDDKGAVKSLSDLKKEFKETQKELSSLNKGTQEYYDKLKQLGSVRDELGDLQQTINTFADDAGRVKAFGGVIQGVTGAFSAAQGAMALFGSESQDLQKTLVKVQAALALQQGIAGVMQLGDAFKILKAILITNPILLIGTVITGIGIALFALRDKIAIVGEAFNAMGNVISSVIQKLKDLSDWLGISSFAADEAADKQIAAAKKTEAAVVSRYDKEIKLAQAAGKDTLELEKKKQEAVLSSARTQVKALEAVYRAQGKLSDEQVKQLEELVTLINNTKTEIEVLEVKQTKKAKEEAKKRSEAYKKELEEMHKAYVEDEKRKSEQLARQRKAEEAYNKRQREEKAKQLEKERIEEENRFKALFDRQRRNRAAILELEMMDAQNDIAATKNLLDKKMEMELDSAEYTEMEKEVIREKYRRQKEDLDNQALQAEFDNYKNLTGSLLNLTDTFFAIRSSMVDKDSQEGRRVAKRQFQIQKGLSASMAAIDGLKAITSILAQYPKFDGGIAMTAALTASGTATMASIAKILATKFNENGGGSSSGVSVEAPRISPPQSQSTMINSDGTIRRPNEQETIKAVVVETDVTGVQKKVKSMESNSKL